MAGPRWVRLDCDYLDNPKVLAAGRNGRDLHLASILWAGRQLSDGMIPAQVVPSLVREAGVSRRAVDLVIGAGLWIPNGGASFELHGFLERNPSRDEVERERVQWRDRQRRRRRRDEHGRYLSDE